MTQSKYLGKIFGGWKVVSKNPTDGNHYIYTLKKKKGFAIKTMTVRDNEMTKFANGKTIEQETLGKAYQIKKNIRKVQNTIFVKKSLFNLFRAI